MSDWIGHLIENWPLWAVIIVLLIVSIVWVSYYLTTTAENGLWSKKEWWQDRAMRLEKEVKVKNVKLKEKKG